VISRTRVVVGKGLLIQIKLYVVMKPYNQSIRDEHNAVVRTVLIVRKICAVMARYNIEVGENLFRDVAGKEVMTVENIFAAMELLLRNRAKGILVAVDMEHIILKLRYVVMVDVENCSNEVHAAAENKAIIQRNQCAVVVKLHLET
jgi:hypothetical protein